MAKVVVLGVTGASGAPYAVRLLDVLLGAGCTVHLSMSPSAVQVFDREIGRSLSLDRFKVEDFLGHPSSGEVRYHHFRDFSAGIASGSFRTDGMVVCPCSMGSLAAIAHGLSENLIHRAADVHLKERRTLIVVPRETPLGLVQLRNMTLLTEAGAVVLPAMPGYYHRPESIADLVDFVVARICDQLGVEVDFARRWGTDPASR
jgi:4-hydroxy-3-polyprenylbenzoate decarboxylase